MAERLIANGLDGVLLATTTVDSVLPVRLRDRGVPFVYFNRTADAVEADSATVDPVPGTVRGRREIVELGHRRIGAIFGPRNTSTAEQRESALRDALDEHGLAIASERHAIADRSTSTPGTTARSCCCGRDPASDGDRLRQRRGRPRGAQRRPGPRASGSPSEVSMVGFDDLPVAAWPLVRLTTVAFDLDAMARKAASLLVRADRSRGAGRRTSTPSSTSHWSAGRPSAAAL